MLSLKLLWLSALGALPIAAAMLGQTDPTPTSIMAAFIAAFMLVMGLLAWTIREDRASLKSLAESVSKGQETLRTQVESIARNQDAVTRGLDIQQEMYHVLLAIHDSYIPVKRKPDGEVK